MQLPDSKALKELLKILRSQGVLQYQSADLTLVLTETLPSPLTKKSQIEDIMGESDEDPALEIERLIDYSSKSPVEDV
jgi:prophage tail gpP-like protein